MSKAGGYILRLSVERSEVFADNLYIDGRFAEPVPEFQHSRSAPLICFVVNEDDLITHLGPGKRGFRAGTGLRRLNVSDIHELSDPISASQVLNKVSGRSTRWIADRLNHGGLLPPKSFEGFVDAILVLAPETRQLIERYGRERRRRIERLSERALESLANQKQAVTTALAIADIDRGSLQDWAPADDFTPTSFLDGLSTVRLREDPMVVNDLMNLPGYEFIKTVAQSAAVFEGEKGHMTIVLANRQALEEQYGTDLIYYNETYKSFVMVQYKAMERYNREAVFRLPDRQLSEEIRRMDGVLSLLETYDPGTSRENFRFTENPFFLKFCPRFVFDPDDSRLVPGMYLPLDYWKRTETDSKLDGPRGGRSLTYQNVGRYFDNSSFVTLVANAWIGTSLSQSEVLVEAIRETLQSGRAAALAVKRDDPGPDEAAETVFNPQEGLEEDEQTVRVRS